MLDDKAVDKLSLDNLLINNEKLFNHVHIVNQRFKILPDKNHYGLAIDYVDLLEDREQFVRELVNTVVDWVYGRAKQVFILNQLLLDARSPANASSELAQKAYEKFRPSSDGKLLHGQFGELLLANCLQHMFGAIPILRKMPLTTSPEFERFGSDAIHFKYINDVPVFYIGEAKSYTSKYSFNKAFETAISSILKEYKNITREIRLYLHEDFLEPETEKLATDLIDGKLKNAEYHLVSIIAYEETNKRDGKTRSEIISNIEAIITERFNEYDNTKIDIHSNPILDRITYVIFPIWEFDRLINGFSNLIPSNKGGF